MALGHVVTPTVRRIRAWTKSHHIRYFTYLWNVMQQS
ncbi:MAG: hypothetical protein QOG79_4204 [Mycobacterium sp.]|jgi:hypothetical protein|nr:hypothetical protein [Mycobacterium sp.]MDT5291307.1 hypothetical protein [Mycobacterium sp.]MDT5300962.1 hypothetical protein [Mycobacterium sp.]MDT5362219.1 hypothetical protein [Mycobacterium sp.]